MLTLNNSNQYSACANLRMKLRCSRLLLEKRWRKPVSPELSQLIELQELDLEIHRVSGRLSRIPEERESTENDFKQHAAEFLDLKSKHEQTLEERKQLEFELATTQQNYDKFEQDKTRVRNEKEYTAVLREIDASRKQIGVLESAILKNMEESKRLGGGRAAGRPDVERMGEESASTLGALDGEQGGGSRQLAEFSERRRK